MKPQDILIILKILLTKGEKWTFASIAEAVKVSASETHSALKRCEKSGLYSQVTEKPVLNALEEFIIHGLKYAFPAEQGALDRGMPTAHSAPPLSEHFAGSEDAFVWPYANGTIRGTSIAPLYSSVPHACENDQELYEYLALIDAIRIGRTRERKMASEMIIEKLRRAVK